ncbi:MAG: DUF3078 domain-containing protein [Bacteroidaceae bacterium]|nr:DUF3078 domain-containing protein [Bacteroidaceae bacterium]
MLAQYTKKKVAEEEVKPGTTQVVKDYLDSLTVLRRQLDSLQQVNTTLRNEVTDGRYFRLFAPTTFYHSGANKLLAMSPAIGDEVTDAVDEAMMKLYMRRPDLVKNNETHLKEVGTLREDVNTELTQKVDLVEMAAPVPEEQEAVPVAVVIKKPNFWKFKGDGYLQFLQNYVTDNWHKGGESNYSAVASATLEANYNDKDKVLFENKLEMKLGFQTSQSDSVHKFKTNNDLIRLNSKLDLQAHKHWYYTLQLLAYTQFTRGLKANDETTYSDFMSPFHLNLGIGMEYKVEALNKRLTGSLNFLPLSFNFTYVDRKALASRNGITGDHRTLEEFASQFTADLKWQITDQISWKTRFYANTSYHRALIEWENQFELKVTKYISANLFLYPRFDDSNARDDKMGYFQFQEWSSLGLTYSF